MELIIVWRNKKPFKINIDSNKSIADLKNAIASHFDSTYTGFNILNGIDVIDKDKDNSSISSCNLKRVVRLPDNYDPGSFRM